MAKRRVATHPAETKPIESTTRLMMSGADGQEKKDEQSDTSTTGATSAQDVMSLVPGICEGAGPFLLITAVWVLWTLIIPLCILLPLSYHYSNNTKWALRATLISMAGTGVLLLVYALSGLFVLCRRVPVLPSAGPLSAPHSQPNPSYHIKVQKLLVIINEHGGDKTNKRRFSSQCAPLLTAAGITTEIQYTQHQGHAKQLAHTLPLQDYQCMAVMGGDGTLHEAINGLLSRDDHYIIPLALLPGGTGNALATDLGTLDLATTTQRIIAGEVCYIDVNYLTSSHPSPSIPALSLYSVECITWGLIGNVAVQSELPIARVCGPSRYDLCAIWGILKAFTAILTLTYHHTTSPTTNNTTTTTTPHTTATPAISTSATTLTESFVTAFINNTQFFAKSLRAAPKARLDDGLFDLLFLNTGSRSFLLALFVLLPTGRHIAVHDAVKYVQTSSVVMRPKQERGVINVDGEIVEYEGEIRIECKRKILPMMLESQWKGRQIKGAI